MKTLFSIMSNLQNHYHFKLDYQKVDQHVILYISHNAPLCVKKSTHMCTFFTMVHCGIFFWCILGFVRWAMHFLGTEYIGRIIGCNVREGSPNSFKDMVSHRCTVYPKKYADGFCFAVLCCGYTLTDFPISIRLTSLALRQSNDCPSASKATLMNMDK